jgi:hypothetical protein
MPVFSLRKSSLDVRDQQLRVLIIFCVSQGREEGDEHGDDFRNEGDGLVLT